MLCILYYIYVCMYTYIYYLQVRGWTLQATFLFLALHILLYILHNILRTWRRYRKKIGDGGKKRESGTINPHANE